MTCGKNDNDCFYEDEVTGACTNDDCEDGEKYVRALGPADMYKALYLLIFNMPLAIQKHVLAGTIPKESFAGIPAAALDNFDEEKMKIIIDYDPKLKRYTLETSQQLEPMKPVLVPKKIIRHRRRLILPN